MFLGIRLNFAATKESLRRKANAQKSYYYYITGDEWGKKKRPKYEWSAGKQQRFQPHVMKNRE